MGKVLLKHKRTAIIFTVVLLILTICLAAVGCGPKEPPDAFDPLGNKFLKHTEDWEAVDKETSLSVGNKFLTIKGAQSSGAKKTWTLPDEDDLWVDFDYAPNGADVTVKVEVTIGEKTITAADALPVKTGFGVLNYQLPIANFFTKAEYGGKSAVLTLTAEGSTSGVKIANVVTRSKDIAGTRVEGNPYLNTFAKLPTDPIDNGGNLEDWYIGGHLDSVFGGHQQGSKIEGDWGMVMIEGSDALTGDFDKSVNSSMSKYFTMPDFDITRFNFNVKSIYTGTDVMLAVIADGKVFSATGGDFTYIEKDGGVYTLSCAVKGMKGKPAQAILLQRDSGKHNGEGEALWFTRFEAVNYTSDPLDNRFMVDLEDWKDAQNITVKNNSAIFSGNASMKKTVTLPTLSDRWMQNITLSLSANGTTKYKLDMDVTEAGAVKTVALIAPTQVTGEGAVNVSVFEETLKKAGLITEALSGKSVTFTLSTVEAQADATLALSRFYIGKKWSIDPLDNQFFENNEDWATVETLGWDGNGANYDMSWHRMQIDYNSAGGDVGMAKFAKTYTLPDAQKLSLDFNIEGNGGGSMYAGKVKLEMKVGTQSYTLLDTRIAKGTTAHSLKLDNIDALSGVTYQNKEVTLTFTYTSVDTEQMVSWMNRFKTSVYTA